MIADLHFVALKERRAISSLAKRTLSHQKSTATELIWIILQILPSLYGMSYNHGQYSLSEKTQTESVALISYSEFKYYETR